MGNGMLFTLPNEIFEGRFNGYRVEDGSFKLLFSNGEFYEGAFKNGYRQATGQHYYRNGDHYDGEWVQDKRVGKGKVYFKDGGRLTTTFVDDRAEGLAEMEDPWGNFYQTEKEDGSG
jgi:antitoxin component YwqK of YwqJK toxin-antitoxin module